MQRKLVFYVAVDEPGVRPRWGGTLAAPVFRRVMEKTLSHLMSQEEPRPVLVKTPIVPRGTGLGPLAQVNIEKKRKSS